MNAERERNQGAVIYERLEPRSHLLSQNRPGTDGNVPMYHDKHHLISVSRACVYFLCPHSLLVGKGKCKQGSENGSGN
jgi:hypothetical protein